MTERLHPVIAMMPDASGNYTRYQHHACGPVRTDTPEKDGLVITQYSHGTYLLQFSGGRFRSTQGPWGQPQRWAYVTWEEVDDTLYTPGPVQPASTGNWLQDLVNLLTKFYKWSDILNARDRSPHYNPEEGAPEE